MLNNSLKNLETWWRTGWEVCGGWLRWWSGKGSCKTEMQSGRREPGVQRGELGWGRVYQPGRLAQRQRRLLTASFIREEGGGSVMVSSHSGPDLCYYRAAAAEQISGPNEAFVSDVAGADVVLMKTKPCVTRQPTTINYTLACSYTLRPRQGCISAHTPHLPTPKQIQDGTCIRPSTCTFIFLQHCGAL